jgi:hypothetical protein
MEKENCKMIFIRFDLGGSILGEFDEDACHVVTAHLFHGALGQQRI